MKESEYLKKKIGANIREYEKGTKMSNGKRIESKKQALAIAYSEARKKKK